MEDDKNNKEVEPTTEEQASDSDNKPSEEQGDNDYQKEIERLKAEKEAREKQLSQAEYKLTEQSKELKELRSQKEDKSDSTDIELEPEPEKDISTQVDEKINSLKNELVTSQLEDELAKIENPDERELTKQYYQDKLVHSGTSAAAIRSDIENARFLANKAKYQARASEISNAQNISVPGDPSVAGDMEEQSKPSNLSPAEKALLERRGLTPDDVGKSIQELSKK